MSQNPTSTQHAPKRIGMIAGWGRYPVDVAQALKRQGYEVHCFGVFDHADEAALRAVCTEYRTIGMCRLGKAVWYMRRHGITDVLTLGKYFKWRLFQSFRFWRNVPDFLTFRTYAAHFLTHKKDCKDDSLMLTMARMFAKFGIRLGCPTDFVPELLVDEGILTQTAPTEAQWRDIRYGFQVAKELGRFDIGQTVLVSNGVVIAMEAIEGTDACIERAGKLCSHGGLVMVKVAKPQQDMRFDVPTIGMTTLENFAAAGGRVIAVEAKKTILIAQSELLEFANQHGIAVVAVCGAEVPSGSSNDSSNGSSSDSEMGG